MAELGVNIDHVATVRQARRTNEPDPVWAATLAELGGADGITLHLREDRRHIQDRDLRVLRETVTVKLNLELAAEPAIVQIACDNKPDQATLVPEKREEVTTEGGLDLLAHKKRVADAIARLRDAGIGISLFLDPNLKQLDAAKQLGADAVELHTGEYALATGAKEQAAELAKLVTAGDHVRSLGMTLHAGHGLTYRNVKPVAAITGMSELNIGHSIVARALMVGFEQAVREMKRLIS
jgi:pyridoxine 5-phosphate synthase